MTGNEIRQRLPYAGLPIVAAVLLVIQAGRVETFILLRNEMLIVFGYIASVLDLRFRKIPNTLVLSMLGAWVFLMTLILCLDTGAAIGLLWDSVLGFVLGGGLFLLTYLISRKGLGGGDVKLMACTGLYLGFYGIIPAIFCGTLLAALTGLALILAKKLGRKDMIPLAPFLFVGILITVFLQ